MFKSERCDYDLGTVVLLAYVSHIIMVQRAMATIIIARKSFGFCLQGPLCTKRCMTTASTWKDMVGMGQRAICSHSVKSEPYYPKR